MKHPESRSFRDDQFDREWKKTRRSMDLWFIFVAPIGLALTGVVIWAIIQLVGWVTSK